MTRLTGYLCIVTLTFTLGHMLQPQGFDSLAKGLSPPTARPKGQKPDLLPLANHKRNWLKACCK